MTARVQKVAEGSAWWKGASPRQSVANSLLQHATSPPIHPKKKIYQGRQQALVKQNLKKTRTGSATSLVPGTGRLLRTRGPGNRLRLGHGFKNTVLFHAARPRDPRPWTAPRQSQPLGRNPRPPLFLAPGCRFRKQSALRGGLLVVKQLL